MDSETKQLLGEVFGEATTQQAMLAPTHRDTERTIELVAEMPVDLVLQELGVIAANQIANVIDMAGLRPADFAGIPDLPQALAAKIVEHLSMGEETFFDAFARQLAARG